MHGYEVRHNLLSLDALPLELLKVHVAWREAKGDRIGPSRKAFDLLRIPASHLPFASVSDYSADADAFIIRFFGTGLVAIDGCEMTGKRLEATPHPGLRNTLVELFHKVVADRRENFAELMVTDRRGPQSMSITGRWPLSEDGETVTGVLSVAHPNQVLRDLNEILGLNGSEGTDNGRAA